MEVVMTVRSSFLEPLESRQLLNGQIEVLQGAGTFTTSDVTDLMAGNGVHVRANTSGTILGSAPEKNTYEWDFGDSASGEFNKTPGFSSAHVYDTPGTYTISLKVTDGDTGAVRSDSVDVTIGTDTRTKYYVSSAGSDSNAGTSTSAPLKSLRAAFQKITSPNVEILLNRGDTFKVADDTNYLPLQVNQNNVYIGAYGSSPNKPVVNWMHQGSNATIFKIGTPKHNLTLDGISVTSVAASNPQGGKPDFFSCDSNSTSTNVVVRNVDFDHLDTFFHANGTGITGVLIQGCSSAPTTDPNFVSVKHNDVYATGSDYTYFGNTFGDSFGEHNIRSFADFSLAYKNDLTNPRTGTLDDGTGQNKSENNLRQQLGDYIYWANNTMHSGSSTMGSGNTEGGAPVDYLIMENNVAYQLPPDKTVLKDNGDERLKIEGGVHHVMIRNNVFQNVGKPAIDVVPLNNDNVYIYNNTAYTTDISFTQQPQLDGTSGDFLKFDGGTTNSAGAFYIVNNLYYAPLINTSGSGGIFFNGSGTSMLANVTNNVWPDLGTSSSISVATVKDGSRSYLSTATWNGTTNVGTDTFADVAFNTTSFEPDTSAIIGTDLRSDGVSTDLNGKSRPTSGAWTDGAVELGGATTASISGYYFGDSDGDGTLNGTEVKQSGKTIYLDLNTNGVKDTGEPTSTTDANGNYSFTGLAAGEYFVRRDGLPSGFRISTPAEGFYDVVLADGESATDKNFGSTSNALISGLVFDDANNNGAQDGGEVGLSGITVYADINTNGTLDAGDKSTTTDASGNWSIHELGSGTYQLRVVPGTGFQQTLPASNGAISLTVSGGQVVSNELFGIRPTSTTGSISGHYFGDTDGDGVWDANESAQSGKVMYIDANNNGVKDTGESTSTTDVNGLYSFSGLGEGTYVVRRDGLPSGFRFSIPDAQFYSISLQAGQSSTDNDFGTTQRVRISGFYFGDTDGDGVWDANEDGQSGKTMYLDSDNDGVKDAGEMTSVTDETGYYSFIGLDSSVGTYHVRRDGLPSGYHLTVPSSGVYDIVVSAGTTYDNKNFGSAPN
jgi:protocatechuate 3,4-dioxygenase beta subunit